jgi:exodeoxyribonuclease V gamma subunit
MIQVYACSSLADINQHIQHHIQGGDVLTQDWIITSHPAQNRWISQSLAQHLNIRTQIEVYSTSTWLQKIKKLAWPLAPNPISIAQITWALLSIAPEWITQEPKADPLKALIATKGYTLGGRRYQTAHQLAQWVLQLMRHKPHWLHAWSQHDLDFEAQSNPTWWPSLWRTLDQYFEGRLHHNLCLQLCESILQQTPRIQSQVRQMIFCGQHVYQGETLKIAQTLSQIIPVIFYSIDPTYTMYKDQNINQNVDYTIKKKPRTDLHTHLNQESHFLRTPLLQGAGMGFTAHRNHHPLHQSDLFIDPYPRCLPSPQVLDLSNQTNSHHFTDQYRVNRTNEPQNKFHPLSLLKALQNVIKKNEPNVEGSVTYVNNDQSLSFNLCQSDQRQVDALYQTLCACLRRDPTLHPRDILVLCPDIERLVPLITAVFNGQEGEDLRVDHWPKDEIVKEHIEQDKTEGSIKDNTIPLMDIVHETRHTSSSNDHSSINTPTPQRLGAEIARPKGLNPFADLLIHFMQIASGRLYRYDLLQLLKNPLVSDRFQLELPHILQLDQWLRHSGVRWGLDPEHRIACGLNEEAQHTWQFGIDRLLMGHVIGNEGGLFQGVAPLNLGQDDDSLVRFLDFFIVIKELIPLVSRAQKAKDWCTCLVKIGRCLTRPSGEGRWLLNELESDLYQSLYRGAPSAHRLTPQAIIRLLQSGLGRKSMLIDSGKDYVRFYPLDQAYSVPARIICFLDMNDHHFPQVSSLSPFTPYLNQSSVLDQNPINQQYAYAVGSILAAQEGLHFFYQGQTTHGSHKVESPLIHWIKEEIKNRFAIPSTFSSALKEPQGSQQSQQVEPAQVNLLQEEDLIQQITIAHPLHPFSPQNFSSANAPIPDETTISHEPIWLQGAEIWRHAMFDPQDRLAFAQGGVENPARNIGKIRLETLAKLLKNPSEFFLKRGVGMHILKDEEISKERELLDLNSLQNWQLKDRALKLFFELEEQGIEPREHAIHLFDRMRAEGLLPVGGMGQVSFEQTFEEVKVIYERFCEVRQSAERQPIGFALNLPSGRPIRVESNTLFEEQLIFTTPSKHMNKDLYRGRQLLEPWLYHVALCASGKHYEGTVLVSSDGNFKDFPTLSQPKAQEMLDQWVNYMEQGVHHPLRFDPDLSLSYLHYKRHQYGEEFEALSKDWDRSRLKEDIYTYQAFDGEAPWKEQDTLHPDFLTLSEMIFAPLEEAIHQAQSEKINLSLTSG